LHSQNKINIIIAPLDWGMGHCARCVPIINYLQLQGINLFIAGNQQQISFFKNEGIHATYLNLTGYNIHYGANGFATAIKLLLQIPKTWYRIYAEHQQLKKWHQQYNFSIIISDNRYGFYLKNIMSVCITHQLHIQIGFLKTITNFINQYLLKKFTTIWVPDFKNNYLAGELSKSIPHFNMQYLGGLSRIVKLDTPIINNTILVILSGPEPQRTIFENIIITQLQNTKYKVQIIGSNTCGNTSSTNIIKHALLPTQEVQQYMAQAEYIISRSGYTTILDLAKCNRKAILVPTPAQPEQLYLAQYLAKNKRHVSMLQNHFDINMAIENYNNLANINTPILNFEAYKSVIDDCLVGLIK
jgi:uncharacterized protein (TIGR00661 family)